MKEVFVVHGMSCGHCSAAVTAAVRKLKGIKDVVVSLEEKTATVEYDDAVISHDTIIMTIEDEGYEVVR